MSTAIRHQGWYFQGCSKGRTGGDSGKYYLIEYCLPMITCLKCCTCDGTSFLHCFHSIGSVMVCLFHFRSLPLSIVTCSSHAFVCHLHRESQSLRGWLIVAARSLVDRRVLFSGSYLFYELFRPRLLSLPEMRMGDDVLLLGSFAVD